MKILAAVLFSYAMVQAVYTIWYRRKLKNDFITLTGEICESIDKLCNHEQLENAGLEEESMTSKIRFKLRRLEKIMNGTADENRAQKELIQKTISDISHQIKTPIANISMYADMAVKYPEDKQCEEFLLAIQSQSRKLDFLMQNLMKLSYMESGIIVLEKEKQPIYDVLNDAISQITLLAVQKEIHISVKCHKDYMACYDRKWMAEALFNILDNAVKYTDTHGNIWINVEDAEGYMKVQIVDNGIGICREHINDIFQRFYREKSVKNVEGAGIGLHLAREIVVCQGGFITVDSTVGKGSNFCIYFPENI